MHAHGFVLSLYEINDDDDDDENDIGKGKKTKEKKKSIKCDSLWK